MDIKYNRKWRVGPHKFKTRAEAEEYVRSKSQEETFQPSQSTLDLDSSSSPSSHIWNSWGSSPSQAK